MYMHPPGPGTAAAAQPDGETSRWSSRLAVGVAAVLTILLGVYPGFTKIFGVDLLQFIVDGGNAGTVVVRSGAGGQRRDLVITNGYDVGFQGAGVHAIVGTFSIVNCHVTANRADFGGGGLQVWGATVTVNNTTLSANSAGDGAGLRGQQPGDREGRLRAGVLAGVRD